MFEELHSNMIKQLLHIFPLDHLTDEGQPYWQGTKRYQINMFKYN